MTFVFYTMRFIPVSQTWRKRLLNGTMGSSAAPGSLSASKRAARYPSSYKRDEFAPSLAS